MVIWRIWDGGVVGAAAGNVAEEKIPRMSTRHHRITHTTTMELHMCMHAFLPPSRGLVGLLYITTIIHLADVDQLLAAPPGNLLRVWLVRQRVEGRHDGVVAVA